MALLTMEEKAAPAVDGWAPFALGFRPFFLGAGFAAVVLMALWLFWLRGIFALPAWHYAPVLWHAHEMLFGFAAAVIAGFLLTAVRNWTGLPTPQGVPLALLFGLWLLGRAAFLIPGLPASVVLVLDLAFLPAVGAAVAFPIVRARQARNYAFPVILGALTFAAALVDAQMLGYTLATATAGVTLGVYLMVLMMVMMGGRVIPFFTDARVGGHARRWMPVEWLASMSVVAVAGGMLAAPQSLFTITAAAVAAGLHLVRLLGWQRRALWKVPLLWVLHAGYAWIVLGFFLTALAGAGLFPMSLALHAYTVGAIGGLTLGMMARVSLGHTGRTLVPAKIMNLAFLCINAAAFLRVIVPLLWPAWFGAALVAGGLAWLLAFGVFFATYLPVLLRARLDGKPG